MAESTATCWTVVEGAARGRAEDREEFARRYLPVVRAYLAARWRDAALAGEIDDAVQEVFVDCFRSDGALGRADPSREGGFRAFFYGVIRNVALRAERSRARRRVRPGDSSFDPDGIAADEQGLSSVFDREWAASLVRQAGERMTAAAAADEAATKRVEMLKLRFEDGLPIREIARRWGADAERVHREYATAREEFREALREVVRFSHPGSAAEIDAECSRLLHALK